MVLDTPFGYALPSELSRKTVPSYVREHSDQEWLVAGLIFDFEVATRFQSGGDLFCLWCSYERCSRVRW